jgi:hypothetical protein
MFTSFYAFSTFFIAVVVLNISLIIFLGGKNTSSKLFALAAFFHFLWLFSVGIAYLLTDPILVALAVRNGYFVGLSIPFILFFFSLIYPENREISRNMKYVILFGIFCIFILVYAKDIFSLFRPYLGDLISEQTIITASKITKNGYLGWDFGFLIQFWAMLFYGLGFSFVATLYQKYIFQTDELLRKQALFMLLAMVIGMSGVFLCNIMLPIMGIFSLFWFGVLTSLGWVAVVGYSIIKQGQMKVHTVTAELLVVALILIMFIGMFAV